MRDLLSFFMLGALLISGCAVTPDEWRPYPTKDQALQVTEGWNKGQKLPNFKFKSQDGKEIHLSDFDGKVMFVHFWGSWCHPCKKELPDIARVYDSLKQEDISFVFLNMWEPYENSTAYMAEKKLVFPMYDTMSGGFEDNTPLTLANGERVKFPQNAIPRTFVLDRNGIVIAKFSSSKSNWPDFIAPLRDAIEHSGK